MKTTSREQTSEFLSYVLMKHLLSVDAAISIGI